MIMISLRVNRRMLVENVMKGEILVQVERLTHSYGDIERSMKSVLRSHKGQFLVSWSQRCW